MCYLKYWKKYTSLGGQDMTRTPVHSMKYITTFSAWLLLFFGAAHSQQQVPQKFSYQAVAVDGNGAVLENTPLCIRATIISGSFNGAQEWIEMHSAATTDDFGLFTIEIGEGDPIGGAQADFADMRWGNFKHFLKIEMSLDANCTNFILVGTNQLLSVPYALYAERAAVANTAIYADTALFSNVSNVSYYADSSSVSHNSYFSNYSDTTLFAMTTINNIGDADGDPMNEIQDLTLTGSTLTLSGSNAPPINLSSFNAFDPDADPTNEIQDLSLNGSSLILSGSSAPAIDLNASDPDHDPTNELQNLSANGVLLSLSGSNAPAIDLNASDPDHDPTNELQNLNASGALLSLSGSSAPAIDLNASDPDHDPTNELQNLSTNGSILTLSGSNAPPVDLNASDPDHDPTNELQELTFDSTTSMLGITNGNFFIDLSSLSNFNASGSDLDYPQGVANAKYIFIPDTYTVPADSVFYVVASEDEMILPGIGFDFGRHLTGPNLPVFKPGTSVDNCRCIGFLKAMDPFFEPVLIVLTPNQTNFYQVPFSRNLVIKSGLDQSTPITLNGFTISPASSIIKAWVIPQGIQIKNLGNDEIILTGYLLQD